MNLLIVSLDSVRLDAVSRTGGPVHTPRFDAATAGFHFADRCFSVASATRPVHASVFSGLYPFEHGVEGQRSSRLRRSVALLFTALQAKGYGVFAASEAPTVFTGLDFGAPVDALPTAPEAGLALLAPWLERGQRQAVCVFAHFWEAHVPYGAADGLALGETLELVRRGRLDVVRQRYSAAVTRLLEHKVAPLVETCDLERWCVLIFSDHGESWDAQEPYHGETLRNSVLRVPLYLHVPFSGNPPFPSPLQSLVDVHATLCGVLGLDPGDSGSGRDLRVPAEAPVYLAQITPTAARGGDLEVAAASVDGAGSGPRRRWCVFDRQWKYCWEEGSPGVLEEVLSGRAEVTRPGDGRVAALLAHWRRLRGASPHAAQPLPPEAGDGELLDRRLRDLGYL